MPITRTLSEEETAALRAQQRAERERREREGDDVYVATSLGGEIISEGLPPEESTPENCPPGEIPPGGGPYGGEEPQGEFNFPDLNFPDFLSPIEEVDVSPYSGNKSIREINIFDEFFFLRTGTNLFETNEQGEESILVPGFHSQRDILFKKPRIRPAYDIRNLQVETTGVQVDKFRICNNRFWLLRGSETSPIQEEWAQDNTIDSLAQRYYSITIGANESAGVANGIYPIGHQTMQIFFQDQENTSIEYMRQYYNSKTFPGMIYTDFNTSIQQPLLVSELSTESSTAAQAELANRSYIIDFEPVISQRVVEPQEIAIPETRMPSLYREYFRMETKSTEDCDLDDKVQKFLSVNIEHMDEANNSETLRSLYPNYIKISIKRPDSAFGHEALSILDEILESFEQTEFDKYYLEQLTGFDNTYTHRKYVQIADESSPETTQTIRTNDRFSVNFLKVMRPGSDFSHLPQDMSDEDVLQTHVENVINKSQEYPLRFENYNNQEQLLTNDASNQATFKENFASLQGLPIRKFKGAFEGAKAPSFIIGYKIEKRLSPSMPPIQTFYIMERPSDGISGDNKPIEFIDTQVKYGKTYTYRVYSIALVFGTQYKYLPDPIISSGDAAIQFKVQHNNYSQLILAPFFQKAISLTDLPPLPPEVTFAPYQGYSDRMRIIFNHAVGDIKEKPIMILPEDSDIIGSMKQAQINSTVTGRVRYYSDTVPQEYQMFMSTDAPTSYGEMHLLPGMTMLTIPTYGKTSCVYDIPRLKANQNYYFTFRSAEIAGISNPGPVFKVRMVDTPNGIFMIVREYDMYLQREKYGKLEFQRALKISPSAMQRSISYPEGTDLGSRDFALSIPSETLPLGPSSNSIWGKKYKFRITSKISGKMIDLNAVFEQNNDVRLPETITTEGQCEPILTENEPEPPAFTPPPEVIPEPVCMKNLSELPDILGYFNTAGVSGRVYDPDPCNPDSVPVGIEEALGITDNRPERTYFAINLNAIETVEGNTYNLVEWLKKIPEVLEHFQCPDNPGEIIDFLKPEIYKQKEYQESGEDFRVVFGRQDGGSALPEPKHLQDGLDIADQRDVPSRGGWDAHSIIEQTVFWTEPGDEDIVAEINEREAESERVWRNRNSRFESERQADLLTLKTEWNPLFEDEEGNFPERKPWQLLNFIRVVLQTFKYPGGYGVVRGLRQGAQRYFLLYTPWNVRGLDFVPDPSGSDHLGGGSGTAEDPYWTYLRLPESHWPLSLQVAMEEDRILDAGGDNLAGVDMTTVPCAGDGWVYSDAGSWHETGCKPPPCPENMTRATDCDDCICPEDTHFLNEEGKCIERTFDTCWDGSTIETTPGVEEEECPEQPPPEEPPGPVCPSMIFMPNGKKLMVESTERGCFIKTTIERTITGKCSDYGLIPPGDPAFGGGQDRTESIFLEFEWQFAFGPETENVENKYIDELARHEAKIDSEIALANTRNHMLLMADTDNPPVLHFIGTGRGQSGTGPTNRVNISGKIYDNIYSILGCVEDVVCDTAAGEFRWFDISGAPQCGTCPEGEELVDGFCRPIQSEPPGTSTMEIEYEVSYEFTFGLRTRLEWSNRAQQDGADGIYANYIEWGPTKEYTRLQSTAGDVYGFLRKGLEDRWSTAWPHVEPGTLVSYGPFTAPSSNSYEMAILTHFSLRPNSGAFPTDTNNRSGTAHRPQITDMFGNSDAWNFAEGEQRYDVNNGLTFAENPAIINACQDEVEGLNTTEGLCGTALHMGKRFYYWDPVWHGFEHKKGDIPGVNALYCVKMVKKLKQISQGNNFGNVHTDSLIFLSHQDDNIYTEPYITESELRDWEDVKNGVHNYSNTRDSKKRFARNILREPNHTRSVFFFQWTNNQIVQGFQTWRTFVNAAFPINFDNVVKTVEVVESD